MRVRRDRAADKPAYYSADITDGTLIGPPTNVVEMLSAAEAPLIARMSGSFPLPALSRIETSGASCRDSLAEVHAEADLVIREVSVFSLSGWPSRSEIAVGNLPISALSPVIDRGAEPILLFLQLR